MGLRDNTAQSRFELDKNGAIAYADYRREGDTLVIPYVYAPPELRGTGAAGELMGLVAEQARRENLKIVPICGYAAAWLHRHSEHKDLI